MRIDQFDGVGGGECHDHEIVGWVVSDRVGLRPGVDQLHDLPLRDVDDAHHPISRIGGHHDIGIGGQRDRVHLEEAAHAADHLVGLDVHDIDGVHARVRHVETSDARVEREEVEGRLLGVLGQLDVDQGGERHVRDERIRSAAAEEQCRGKGQDQAVSSDQAILAEGPRSKGDDHAINLV